MHVCAPACGNQRSTSTVVPQMSSNLIFKTESLIDLSLGNEAQLGDLLVYGPSMSQSPRFWNYKYVPPFHHIHVFGLCIYL